MESLLLIILKWNGLAKKIGLSLDDQITEFKVENLNRPNKAIVYPFSFLVFICFWIFEL